MNDNDASQNLIYFSSNCVLKKKKKSLTLTPWRNTANCERYVPGPILELYLHFQYPGKNKREK